MARGPQIHQLVKAIVTVAAAALLLQVAPAGALAGEDSTTGISRSTAPTQGYSDGSTTAIDGFAAGAMASGDNVGQVKDGWAHRSTPSVSRDGWEVARIELPRPATVTDGWAVRSDSGGPNLASLDGWAYGSVTGPDTPVQVPSSPPPPRESSPPYAEIALAATLALLVAAGAGFMHHRHQHHLPV